jgi:hypothetical protein
VKFIVAATRTFEDSVVNVVTRLAEVSMAYASRVGDDCRHAMTRLDENPRRGRTVPEMNDERLRELLTTNGAFRVIYFVDVASRIVTLVDFQSVHRFDPTTLVAATKHLDSESER